MAKAAASSFFLVLVQCKPTKTPPGTPENCSDAVQEERPHGSWRPCDKLSFFPRSMASPLDPWAVSNHGVWCWRAIREHSNRLTLRRADSDRERQMGAHTLSHTCIHPASDCAHTAVTVSESMTVTVVLWGYQWPTEHAHTQTHSYTNTRMHMCTTPRALQSQLCPVRAWWEQTIESIKRIRQTVLWCHPQVLEEWFFRALVVVISARLPLLNFQLIQKWEVGKDHRLYSKKWTNPLWCDP